MYACKKPVKVHGMEKALNVGFLSLSLNQIWKLIMSTPHKLETKRSIQYTKETFTKHLQCAKRRKHILKLFQKAFSKRSITFSPKVLHYQVHFKNRTQNSLKAFWNEQLKNGWEHCSQLSQLYYHKINQQYPN